MSKTARDVMVPLAEYPHAQETQSLKEAVELLATAEIRYGGRSSMPRVLLVFDESNHLVGMVRQRDILRGLEPEFHQELDIAHPEAHFKTEIDPNLSDLVDPEDPERIERKLDQPLSKIISELPGQVAADDSLMKVVRELVSKETHIVAVLDDDEVVGVIRSIDVLRAVTESSV